MSPDVFGLPDLTRRIELSIRNDTVLGDYCQRLLPKAIAYCTDVMNHLFRGRLGCALSGNADTQKLELTITNSGPGMLTAGTWELLQDDEDGDRLSVGAVFNTYLGFLPSGQSFAVQFDPTGLTGQCTLVFKADGSPQDDYTIEVVAKCFQASIGGCCINGVCSLRVQQECDAIGGTFLGPDTTCDNGCPGACCLAEGTCVPMLEAQCTLFGGVFQGGGSTCESNPCPCALDCISIQFDAYTSPWSGPAFEQCNDSLMVSLRCLYDAGEVIARGNNSCPGGCLPRTFTSNCSLGDCPFVYNHAECDPAECPGGGEVFCEEMAAGPCTFIANAIATFWPCGDAPASYGEQTRVNDYWTAAISTGAAAVTITPIACSTLIGSCCDPLSGACVDDVLFQDCSAMFGGVGLFSLGSSCNDDPCGSYLGACCDWNTGICENVFEADCLGGWWGPGIFCENIGGNEACSP